jgi:hypothetical protein
MFIYKDSYKKKLKDVKFKSGDKIDLDPIAYEIVEKDRYNSELLLQKWSEADKSAGTFLVEDIEVVDYDPAYESIAEAFWKNISDIDNQVQDYCEESYRKSSFGPENYIADLAWLEFSDDGVYLVCWGRTVNFEIGAKCSYINGGWKIEFC